VEYQKWDFTLTERVLTQFRVVLFYLTLLIYPHPSRLNLDHDFSLSKGIFDPSTTLISILIVIGIMGYSVWVAKKRPLISFCILWYFGNLVIESSIFPLEMAFEHRLYLPMIGPVVLFVVLIEKGWEKIKKVKGKRENGKGEEEEETEKIRQQTADFRHQIENKGQVTDRNWQLGIGYWRGDWPIWGFFILISLVFCIGTYQRNSVWKDPVMLWEDAVKKSSNKSRPYFNVGLSYYDIGRHKDAIEAFQKAIRIQPNDPETYNNLGMAYKAIKDYPKAVDAFQKAIQFKPNYTLALHNLEITYDEIGRPQEALETLKKAIHLKPADADLQNHLGMKYKKLGRYQEAIDAYQNAIRLKSENPEPYNNLGLAYFAIGKLTEAVEAFEKAIRLKPNDGEFYYNLGVTFSTQGNHSAGIEAYQKAIRIKPGHVKARFNMGLSYLILKRKDLAIEQANILMNYDKEQGNKLNNLINK
jgi:tetratricopeptide (TPR) repeat protein